MVEKSISLEVRQFDFCLKDLKSKRDTFNAQLGIRNAQLGIC
jgi:hypothetical protein